MKNVDTKESGIHSHSTCPLCNSLGNFSFFGRDLLYQKTETYSYAQCPHCRAVYQDPIPTPEMISSFYPDHYEQWEQLDEPKQPSRLKQAVLFKKYGYDHLKIPSAYKAISVIFAPFKYRETIHYVPHGRALDIGCGNGEFMRKMNSLGWNFEGVEFSQVAVDVCRSVGLKVFHGNLNDAAFETDRFDLITARHLIEHIPDPKSFFSEISRILKQGGRLVIQTPNSRSLGRKWFGTNWFANDVPRHLVLFCPSNLNMLADQNDMRRKTVKTLSSPKIILNSWDYKTHNRARPSRKKKAHRLLASLYVMLAAITRRGDEIFVVFEKPKL